MNSRKSFVELRHARAFTDRAQHWWKDETRTHVHFRLISFIQSSVSYHHFPLVFIFSPFSSYLRCIFQWTPKRSLRFALDFFCPRQSSFPVAAGPLPRSDESDVPPPSLMDRHDAVYRKKELRTCIFSDAVSREDNAVYKKKELRNVHR
jgi:hypothetical protein